MIFCELQLLDENPSWQLVLAAYRAEELAAAEARAEARKKAKKQAKQQTEDAQPPAVSEVPFDNWTPRFISVDGVPDEELSKIHGKLIALGFLKFKLLGRNEGLGYQLTRLGKQGAMSPEERQTASDEEQVVDDQAA
jgi:hypothetical protein